MSNPGILPHDWFPRSLPDNVIFGEQSWCYSSFAFLHYQSRQPCGVRVGNNTGVYHGTFFDLGPDGQVEIGDYATLVGATIATNSRVIIGDYVFLAHEVTIADSFAAMPGGRMAGRDKYGETPVITINRNSWIGARAVILSGAVIGENAIIGAAAVVDFEVPPYAIVAGNPGRIVGWAR